MTSCLYFPRGVMIAFNTALILICAFSFAYINIANAQGSSAASGTITFIGSIVEPPCEHQLVDNSMETVCWGSKGKKHRLKSALNTIKNGKIATLDNKVKVSFEWINSQKKLGIYTVIYN
ncbi:hypothetical protein [Moellerella wisconsensis]|uniref:Uncharacterized protein n=3 Tax=Moellerella wisconsensis TaxID=158849 RepID=A0ACD3Y3T3_9GAMM|nr:hypothetical protein [Moellerella wisconsensis]UNH23086.1 hypothetical protein MNY68_09480 [Moellerella wisconsensis]UNH29623.1 hypothetical protein MNY72_09520 [Moellerella wisconsensis]UNH37762.1 hypothetical protein MNY70_09535 [Moellerella wisconsensis]UNH41313.1 hypothetical protein MNY66_09545 [Moellerella wisconsensis]WJW80810.1 hypothetical protein QU516_08980 [Moellerella wisconsensis]